MSCGGSQRRDSISISQDASEWIRDSRTLSRDVADEILTDADGSLVAQMGDCGVRAVVDNMEYDCEGRRSFADNARIVDNGFSTLPDDAMIISIDFLPHGANLSSRVLPLAEENMSSRPTDTIQHSSEKSQMMDTSSLSLKEKLPQALDYISYMIHLAVFGILGVFTRYLLQKLFDPVHFLTGDETPLYLDLPANMVGSFIMGWFGHVFKKYIRTISSDHIVVGLTTGYLGSLTTFSGWNQRMLILSSRGHWVFAVLGIILGMVLVYLSFLLGVGSAELFRSLLERFGHDSGRRRCNLGHWKVDSFERHMAVMVVMLLMLLGLWGLSVALAWTKLDKATNGAVLWLACLVGPPGVWLRWYLGRRLNGQGLGRRGLLKWLPFGTFLANFLAACLMAALSTISKAVNTRLCEIIVSGIQLGFLGCLSTVSTFVSEVYDIRQKGHTGRSLSEVDDTQKNGYTGRALTYAAATIVLSFAAGTAVYSVPVWTKHFI